VFWYSNKPTPNPRTLLLSGEQDQNLASEGALAARLIVVVARAAGPERAAVPGERGGRPVERRGARPPTARLGSGRRLHARAGHLRQLRLRPAAAAFPAQTDQQGLQVFPGEARAQAVVPASVLTAFHRGEHSTGPNVNCTSSVPHRVVAVSFLSLNVELRGFG